MVRFTSKVSGTCDSCENLEKVHLALFSCPCMPQIGILYTRYPSRCYRTIRMPSLFPLSAARPASSVFQVVTSFLLKGLGPVVLSIFIYHAPNLFVPSFYFSFEFPSFSFLILTFYRGYV